MEVYLDNSATTKPHEKVIEAMMDCLNNNYGNPSSLHKMGVHAEKSVKNARRIIADTLQINESEFYFTSGGTESNNIALYGAAKALRRKGHKIITTQIEHPAVLNVFKDLEQQGFETHYLSVDSYGLIDVEALKEAIDDKTILISIMHVNNELGTIEPLKEIGEIKRKHENIFFHVDAVQGYGKLPIYPHQYSIDLLSISGHKIHGPKGIGGLYINKNIVIPPLIQGGQQEKNMRSGTENVPGIVGLGEAARIIYGDIEKNKEHIQKVRNTLLAGIKKEISDFRINSDDRCLPHILNISFQDVRAEVLLHMLERDHIYVSTGSACSSHKKNSNVLTAIGLSHSEINGAIRFSFSNENTIEQMDYVLESLKKNIASMRKMLRR